MKTKLLSITELRAKSKRLTVNGYSLEFWPNGIWFIISPSGEGTEVPEEAIAGALAELFRKFF